MLPTETTFRLWDCLLYEGPKILFRVALTLILLNEDRLLRCQNLPDIVGFMRDELVNNESVLHCHTFMEVSIVIYP